MASPQLENGFTRISNELLEAIAKKDMTARAWRCLMGIIRETYGWRRKEAVISNKKLSDLTGIATHHIVGVVKELERIGIITKTPMQTGSVIAFNKDYDSWGITVDGNTSGGNTSQGNTGGGITQQGITSIPVDGNTPITVDGNTSGYLSPDLMRPAENLKKELNKDKENITSDVKKKAIEYTEDFEKFWEIYPRKEGKSLAFKCWKARIKEGGTPEGMILAAKKYVFVCKQQNTEDRFYKMPRTFLNPDWVEWRDRVMTKPQPDYLNGLAY